VLKNRSAFLDLFKKWKFFSLKDSSKSKWESRKKYANEIVAMENEMKEAKEKILIYKFHTKFFKFGRRTLPIGT
jgi:hypothetical protein